PPLLCSRLPRLLTRDIRAEPLPLMIMWSRQKPLLAAPTLLPTTRSLHRAQPPLPIQPGYTSNVSTTAHTPLQMDLLRVFSVVANSGKCCHRSETPFRRS